MCELEEYARAAPSMAEHGPDPMAEEDTESDDGEDSMRSGFGESDEDFAEEEAEALLPASLPRSVATHTYHRV